MSDSQELKMSRRTALKRAATMAAGAVAVPLLFSSKEALANGTWRTKGFEQAVQYRTHPNGNKECGKCSQFVAGRTAGSDGYCKVVEAMITPHGYCNCYTAS